jgi:hypothetical protein
MDSISTRTHRVTEVRVSKLDYQVTPLLVAFRWELEEARRLNAEEKALLMLDTVHRFDCGH